MTSKIADAGAAVKGSNPEPAMGQVWRSIKTGREYTVAKVGDRRVAWGGGEGGWDYFDSVAARYTCIGIETPHGRVMVGEQRRAHTSASGLDYVEFEVCHILSDARVWISDGVEGWPEKAIVVVAWPLVPGPLVKAAETAMREPTQWDAVTLDGIYSNRPDVAPMSAQTFRDAMAKAQADIGMPVFYIESASDVNITPRVYSDKIEAACGFVNPPDPIANIRTMAGKDATVTLDDSGLIAVVLPAGTSKIRRDAIFAEVVMNLPLTMCLTVDIAAPPDPRIERESRRRAIDKILAEDARRFPAFATARRAAVIACYESAPPMGPEDMVPVSHAEIILTNCHRYEAQRGGLTKPREGVCEWADLAGGTYLVALALYERARSLP